MNEEVEAYLVQLAEKVESILKANLVGVYLMGSGAQGDFRVKSDLDVLVVVSGEITAQQKGRLVHDLDHSQLHVPAAGLDLMIVRLETVTHPQLRPPYEFWFSTGSTWKTEVDLKGSTSEALIFLGICAQSARTIAGKDHKEVFRPVPFQLLLSALIDVLEWHRAKILDPFHDPNGQYSILNASRAWLYVLEEKLVSKKEGGQWVLSREPDNLLIRNALAIRDGASVEAPLVSEVEKYLDQVILVCRSRLEHA